MSVSESERRDIYNSLEATIGLDPANNLMKLLPYQPADQLVTRTDMHAHTTILRGEMAELRAELKGEMGELRSELRGEMTKLRGELSVDMTELCAELHGDMTKLRAEFHTSFGEQKAATQRLIGVGIVVNAIAVATTGLL